MAQRIRSMEEGAEEALREVKVSEDTEGSNPGEMGRRGLGDITRGLKDISS